MHWTVYRYLSVHLEKLLCYEKLIIEAFISNTGRLNMTSNFDNFLMIVIK